MTYTISIALWLATIAWFVAGTPAAFIVFFCAVGAHSEGA